MIDMKNKPPPPITVKTILEDWLDENKFAGLYAESLECSCTKEDLMPCEFDCVPYCQPGYYVELSEDDDPDMAYEIDGKKYFIGENE
jgi:hypothetical protein